jgi:hypothetical protein
MPSRQKSMPDLFLLRPGAVGRLVPGAVDLQPPFLRPDGLEEADGRLQHARSCFTGFQSKQIVQRNSLSVGAATALPTISPCIAFDDLRRYS